MPDPNTIVGFTETDARDLLKTRDRVLGSHYNAPTGPRTPPAAPQMGMMVQLTSLVANAKSWYPGTYQQYSAGTGTWSSPATCWVLDPNGGVPTSTTTKFGGLVVDVNPADGLPVVATMASVAGGADVVQKDYFYYRQVGTSPIRYYGPSMVVTGSITNAVLTANQLYAFPYIEARGGTLDRIGLWLATTHAGAKARLGIYRAASDTDIRPSALVIDSGEFDCSVGSNAAKIATINQQLSANTLYYLVLLTNDGTATFEVQNVSFAGLNLGGMRDIATGEATIFSDGTITVAQAYGALPDPFPAGLSFGTSIGGFIPLIAVRYSA